MYDPKPPDEMTQLRERLSATERRLLSLESEITGLRIALAREQAENDPPRPSGTTL